MITRIGAVTRTIHAPSVNLTTEKIITINNETAPASQLIPYLTFQPSGLVRFEWRAIPNPAKVNPVNTPNA